MSTGALAATVVGILLLFIVIVTVLALRHRAKRLEEQRVDELEAALSARDEMWGNTHDHGRNDPPWWPEGEYEYRYDAGVRRPNPGPMAYADADDENPPF